jgi:hypothetical protein
VKLWPEMDNQDLCTVEPRLSDLNGIEGHSDNREYRMMRNTVEKDDAKYQLKL